MAETITATSDREHELAVLLRLINQHPEREWRGQRERVAILQRLLGAEQVAAKAVRAGARG